MHIPEDELPFQPIFDIQVENSPSHRSLLSRMNALLLYGEVEGPTSSFVKNFKATSTVHSVTLERYTMMIGFHRSFEQVKIRAAFDEIELLVLQEAGTLWQRRIETTFLPHGGAITRDRYDNNGAEYRTVKEQDCSSLQIILDNFLHRAEIILNPSQP